MSVADVLGLDPETVDGMLLNIPRLEAMEDLRQAKLIGAIFGGENGREYLDFLVDLAWEDDAEMAEQVKHHIAAADADRGLASEAPDPAVQVTTSESEHDG